jgi:hypothetical protein
MKHINLDEPIKNPAVSKRLLSIADAVEGWASGVREKLKEK